MAKDNSNSQGLILRMYPTINIQPLKTWSSYLGVSLGLSLVDESEMGSWDDLVFNSEANWCKCVIHWGKRTHCWAYSPTWHGALSLRSVLETRPISWGFFLFTTVHSPSSFATSSSLSCWNSSGCFSVEACKDGYSLKTSQSIGHQQGSNLHCCSCMVSPRGNPSKLRTAKSLSNRATFMGLSSICFSFLFFLDINWGHRVSKLRQKENVQFWVSPLDPSLSSFAPGLRQACGIPWCVPKLLFQIQSSHTVDKNAALFHGGSRLDSISATQLYTFPQNWDRCPTIYSSQCPLPLHQ